MVERPCLRSSGRNRGKLREGTPTTEDNETEIVTPTESLNRGKEREPGRIYYRNPGRERPQIVCERELALGELTAYVPIFLKRLRPLKNHTISLDTDERPLD